MSPAENAVRACGAWLMKATVPSISSSTWLGVATELLVMDAVPLTE